MTARTIPGAPTELDLCVLAVVWRDGPLSAYRIRHEFARSLTPEFSGSTGTVYPAIRRLQRLGLVVAGDARDRRGTQMLSVTPEGRAVAKDWLQDFSPELGRATPDPLRTRGQFLDRLTPGERRRFFRRAAEATMRALDHARGVLDGVRGNPAEAMDVIGYLGVVRQLEARLLWLGEAEQVMENVCRRDEDAETKAKVAERSSRAPIGSAGR